MPFVTCKNIGDAIIAWIRRNSPDGGRRICAALDCPDHRLKAAVVRGGDLRLTVGHQHSDEDDTEFVVTLPSGGGGEPSPQTIVKQGAGGRTGQNTYTADHAGTEPDVIWRTPWMELVGDMAVINVWNPDKNDWGQFAVQAGEAMFNNPTFYITDGAPAPDTSTFTVGGNTINNAFGSADAAMNFIRNAFIFGTITLDIMGRVHNMNLNPDTVKGASAARVRPRSMKAENLILEYAKTSTASIGITAGGGLQVTLQGGFYSQSFGEGNMVSGVNAPIRAIGPGSTVNVQVDVTKADQHVRHRGKLASQGNIALRGTDSGGTIAYTVTNTDPAQRDMAATEFFALDQPANNGERFSYVDRIGGGCTHDITGWGRVYETDFYAIREVDAGAEGTAYYRFGGQIGALNPSSIVKGPGNFYISSPGGINLLRSTNFSLRSMDEAKSVGTSLEGYKTVMRYEARPGTSANLTIDADRMTAMRFTAQNEVQGSGTYGTFYGTAGTDLPAGT